MSHTKAGKPFDGGGLFLNVRENGARYWRMKYRNAGSERLLSFGVHPEVSLWEARRRRDAAREAIRDGKDPAAMKRGLKLAATTAEANSFEAIGREWLATQKKKLAPATYVKSEWLLGNVWP